MGIKNYNKLKIYDLFGRLIKTISENSILETAKPYLWNRNDRLRKKYHPTSIWQCFLQNRLVNL